MLRRCLECSGIGIAYQPSGRGRRSSCLRPGHKSMNLTVGGAVPYRILVIDDEPDIRDIIRATLSLEPWMVDTAVDGREALDRLCGVAFDVAILDIFMPRLNGLEVLWEVQKRRIQTDVIVLTGHGSTDLAVTAMKAGARDYVEKPIDVPKFIAVVRNLLERRQPSPPHRREAAGCLPAGAFLRPLIDTRRTLSPLPPFAKLHLPPFSKTPRLSLSRPSRVVPDSEGQTIVDLHRPAYGGHCEAVWVQAPDAADRDVHQIGANVPSEVPRESMDIGVQSRHGRTRSGLRQRRTEPIL